MKINMGKVDRVARVAVALLIAGLYMSGTIQGTLAIAAGVLAGVFVLTSAVGFCPLYAPLGISTCPRTETAKK